MECLQTYAHLQHAIDQLLRIEPRFKRIIDQHGLPSLRSVEPGLKSLLRIVTDQLISLKAGEAIWRRLEVRLGDFDGRFILECPEAELRALGLSGGKARTFHAAASFFSEFHQDELVRMSNDEAVKTLTKIRGIGPWTADIYLLSAMSRADAWPAGDLALQVASQHLLGLPERPGSKVMLAISQPWRPVRSAAARLLWSHYRGLKGLDQRVI